MFKRMKIAEQVYKGATPSKKIMRGGSNRDIHFSKRKVGENAPYTKPNKCHADKPKTKNVVSPRENTTGVTST